MLFKKTPTKIIFRGYCQISNNTCFEEHLGTATSENNDKKRFLGKATGDNDHYMINMVRQRPKIAGN